MVSNGSTTFFIIRFGRSAPSIETAHPFHGKRVATMGLWSNLANEAEPQTSKERTILCKIGRLGVPIAQGNQPLENLICTPLLFKSRTLVGTGANSGAPAADVTANLHCLSLLRFPPCQRRANLVF